MGALQAEAICLRCWDYSETSQTVSLLTREFGVLRGLAKGSRRDRSPFSGGFEPITSGHLVAYRKPSSELATLASWALDRPFRTCRTDLTAHYAACYTCDLVHHAVTQDDPSPELFDAVLGCLTSADRGWGQTLDQREAGRDMALLEMQWSVLARIGYRPELHRDVRTDGPLPERGQVLFDAGGGGLTVAGQASRRDRVWPVRAGTVGVLRALSETGHPGGNTSETGPEGGMPIGRASRLLASYTGVVLGRVVPSVRFVYPEVARRLSNGR